MFDTSLFIQILPRLDWQDKEAKRYSIFQNNGSFQLHVGMDKKH